MRERILQKYGIDIDLDFYVIIRPMTKAKWLLKRNGDKLFAKQTYGWESWETMKKFIISWIDDALNSQSIDYEDDLIIKSFETFNEAYDFIKENGVEYTMEEYKDILI
jgi:hypothetical protein